MRLEPDGKWLAFTAEEWLATNETAFCWHARVRMAPLVTAIVEDAFEDGHGRLDAKLWGAISIAHGEGPELDRGEVQRYLAELPWNPGALVYNTRLQFEERPDGAVRIFTEERTLYVDFFFNAAGDVTRTFCANRPYRDEGPRAWEGHFSEYEELGGIRIPTRGEVTWLLAEGPFTYWRGEVTSLVQSE